MTKVYNELRTTGYLCREDVVSVILGHRQLVFIFNYKKFILKDSLKDKDIPRVKFILSTMTQLLTLFMPLNAT